MKKSNNALIWGLIILVAGIGLVFFAIMPSLAVFAVPVWKWLIAALLVFVIFNRLIYGKSLAQHLNIFIPLALLVLLFEKELGKLLGKGEDANFINNWIVILASVLVTVAIFLIFRKKKDKTSSVTYSNCSADGTRSGDNSAFDNIKGFSMGSHVYYIDADARPVARVSNSLGRLDVYYQNTDVGDLSRPLSLYVKNSVGETVVHVPQNWHVACDCIGDNIAGTVSVRDDAAITIRTLNLTVENTTGAVKVVS